MHVRIVARLAFLHQKENKATQNGGHAFFFFFSPYKTNSKSWHYSWNKILGHLLSFDKKLLRHIMVESTRVEGSRERDLEAGDLTGISHPPCYNASPWKTSEKEIKHWFTEVGFIFILSSHLEVISEPATQFPSVNRDGHLRTAIQLTVIGCLRKRWILQQPCSYMSPLTQDFLVKVEMSTHALLTTPTDLILSHI